MHIHFESFVYALFFAPKSPEITASSGKITVLLDIYDFFVYNSKWCNFEYLHICTQFIKILTKDLLYMRLNKLLKGITALALTACMLASPAAAMKLVGSRSIYSKLGIDSKISAGVNLSPEDAAMRLYYIGFITGSGTDKNGAIEFGLGRGLNRVEAAVFAVRLLGGELNALTNHYSHPFTYVPEWSSDYVGYLYKIGLLRDIDGEFFMPDSPETTDRFMGYCLYALGYRTEMGDYTIPIAAEYARDIGICITEKDAPLTRSGAVAAMYNTLRTTIKDSKRVYSDLLVESGVISYQDAVFFLWTDSIEETETYMSVVGYNNGWIVPDGYYTIKATDGGKILNVAVDGYNNDYEGVGVTLWNDTKDITQTFRLQRTERGTYYIYSAASKNGYGRVIGSSGKSDNTGLYGTTSQNAMEFNIQCTADGHWIITSADVNDNRCLSVVDPTVNGAPVSLKAPGDAQMQTWIFDRQGVMNSSGEELAIFVADSMVITQGAYDSYSHWYQNAIDMHPTENKVKAPFNATVVRIDSSWSACNAVWIQSNEKVRYADGSYDYMTLCFLHDNYIGDIYVGRKLIQGEYFYDCGNYGVSSGIHVHVAAYRGAYNNTMRIGDGTIRLEDALFLPDNTYIYNSYGLDWNRISLAD